MAEVRLAAVGTQMCIDVSLGAGGREMSKREAWGRGSKKHKIKQKE